MKITSIYLLTAVCAAMLAAGCSSVPEPGALRAEREPREPIVAIEQVSDSEIAAYLHVPSPQWRDQIVYFIMTDRFDDGNPDNSNLGYGEFDPRYNSHFSGGDLPGILDNLDYIKGLGATAIWITPPVANLWWDPKVEYGGYHGYWAEHFKEVDKHFGTLEDYQRLSATLHKNDMYLIQDIVTNHTGNFFTFTGPRSTTDYSRNFERNLDAVPVNAPTQEPFHMNDYTNAEHREADIYHWTGPITNYQNENQVRTFQLSDLDDVNTSNPVVREALRDSFNYWIEQVGVDGYRIDTVKYVEFDFWHDFHHNTEHEVPGILPFAERHGKDNFMTFGEAWYQSQPYDDTADREIAAYLGTEDKPKMPSIINFPLHVDIRDVFSAGRPTDQLTFRFDSMYRHYPDPTLLMNFIDNHDMNRFLHSATYEELQQALLFMFTIPGIPVVYYGTEQEFDVTRRAMFADGFDSGGVDHFNHEVRGYQYLQDISALRTENPVFSRGIIDIVKDAPYGSGVLAYTMEWEDDYAVVLMNTSNRELLMDNVRLAVDAGSILERRYQIGDEFPEEMTIEAGGVIHRTLGPKSAVVYLATDRSGEILERPGSIAIDNLSRGQVFDFDGEVRGISEGIDSLSMVINHNHNRAIPVDMAADGSWQTVFPAETLPNGHHYITFTGEGGEGAVYSDSYVVEVDLEFVLVTEIDDPIGDDAGPQGRYEYPTDDSFTNQMDIAGVEVWRAGPNLKLGLQMAGPISTSWNPIYGFDHVAFYIYLDVPDEEQGASAMPYQNAEVPNEMSWNYMAMLGGWMSYFYHHEDSGTHSYGTPVSPSPAIEVDEESQTIYVTISAEALGEPDDLSGTRIYVTTWDYDGLESANRMLRQEAGQYIFGGGDGSVDPLIMDDSEVIVVP